REPRSARSTRGVHRLVLHVEIKRKGSVDPIIFPLLGSSNEESPGLPRVVRQRLLVRDMVHSGRMDPRVHRGALPLRDAYRLFGRREAHGVSAVYETWAESVADDDAVLALIGKLPAPKRQPNLVFAAARH